MEDTLLCRQDGSQPLIAEESGFVPPLRKVNLACVVDSMSRRVIVGEPDFGFDAMLFCPGIAIVGIVLRDR